MLMKPPVVDIFPYNGDFIAPFRMAYLDGVVDHFVVVESNQTFSGVPKDEYFFERNEHLFSRFRQKTTFLKVEHFPPAPEAFVQGRGNDACSEIWWRERYQRDFAAAQVPAITGGNSSLLICSDADEIPRRSLFGDLLRLYYWAADPVYLEMDLLYYNFHWAKGYKWAHRPFLIRSDGMETRSIDEIRLGRVPRGLVLKDAGWHLSYFMSADEMVRKIEGFSHQEFNLPGFKSAEHLRACLREGRDLFLRPGEDLVRVPDGSSLPEGWEDVHARLLESQRV